MVTQIVLSSRQPLIFAFQRLMKYHLQVCLMAQSTTLSLNAGARQILWIYSYRNRRSGSWLPTLFRYSRKACCSSFRHGLLQPSRSLHLRLELCKRFLDGPPLAAAVSAVRLAQLFMELGQYDRAAGTLDSAGYYATLAARFHDDVRVLETISTLRHRIRRLEVRLARANRFGVSRFWQIDEPKVTPEPAPLLQSVPPRPSAILPIGLHLEFRRLRQLFGSGLKSGDVWIWDTSIQTASDSWRACEMQSLQIRKAGIPDNYLRGELQYANELFFHLGAIRQGETVSPVELDPGPYGNALAICICLPASGLLTVRYRDSSGTLHSPEPILLPAGREIEQLVGELHTQLANLAYGASTDATGFDACAARLARAIGVDKLAGSLPPFIESLSIRPDAWLHSVPFAAMPLPDGTRLGMKYRISITPVLVAARPRQGIRGNCVVAVVRHDVRNPSSPSGSYPVFPGVVLAVQAWRTENGGPVADIGLRAPLDRGNLARVLADASEFCFAGHGWMAEADPRENGLVLVPKPDRPEIFSIADLAAIRSEVLDTVCLFCCSVGDSLEAPYGSTAGLVHSFLRAGARQVLASLWPARADVARA